jgi:hypothetical protein
MEANNYTNHIFRHHKQADSVNCGVISIIFLENLIKDIAPQVNAEDEARFKRKITSIYNFLLNTYI